jgi:calcineurin-like phosphoesterase
MKNDYDDPFREIDNILSNLAKKNISAIIVDIHAEATSEKVALKHYLDGRVSALLGTHTHIMTADSEITKKGTAYITDTGMVGAADGVIGVDKDNIIKAFKTQVKYPHVIPEKGRAIFNAVLLSIDEKTKKAKSIKPITKFVDVG